MWLASYDPQATRFYVAWLVGYVARADHTANLPASRSNQLCGRQTISGSYVSRIGHIHGWLSSSAQSGNEIAEENGSTSQVLDIEALARAAEAPGVRPARRVGRPAIALRGCQGSRMWVDSCAA